MNRSPQKTATGLAVRTGLCAGKAPDRYYGPAFLDETIPRTA